MHEIPLVLSRGCACARAAGRGLRHVDRHSTAHLPPDLRRLAIAELTSPGTIGDDVVNVSHYPEAILGFAARRARRLGLGIRGLADLLAELGIPYDSWEAIRAAMRLVARIQRIAHEASAGLAEERGPFPLSGCVRSQDGTPHVDSDGQHVRRPT